MQMLMLAALKPTRRFHLWTPRPIGRMHEADVMPEVPRPAEPLVTRLTHVPGTCTHTQRYIADTQLGRDQYTDIAKFAGHLPHRYGNSRAVWDHTVLPATRQR